MSSMTLTPRVKDTNKLLDFIDNVIETVGNEKIKDGPFIKSQWEDQLQRILVGAFLTHTSPNPFHTPKQVAKVQLSVPLCIVYFNLIRFLQDLDTNLELEEIDLANDFGQSTFVALMQILHSACGLKTDQFNNAKMYKWLNMTGTAFKKRKSLKVRSNETKRILESTD